MASDEARRGQPGSDTVKQCISVFESMLGTSPRPTLPRRPSLMDLPGSSWQQGNHTPRTIGRQLQRRCFDDEDGGCALGFSPVDRQSLHGSFSTSSDSLEDADFLSTAPQSPPPSPPAEPSDAPPSDKAPAGLSPCGAPPNGKPHTEAPPNERKRVAVALSCIELAEWTGLPGDAAAGAAADVADDADAAKADPAEVLALRIENQRLLADLQRTQALLLKKKSENANMKNVVKELTEKRATDVAQRHQAQEAMVSMQYDNMRLQRAHDIARQHVQTQQASLAAKEAELSDCAKRLAAAECALATAQRAARALRSQNAALEKRLSFLERLQLVESSLESVCVRSYTQTIELY